MTSGASKGRAMPPTDPDTRSCICWWCEEAGTVLLELHSLGEVKREWFCEKDARDFEKVAWRRVDEEPQLGLFP